MRKFIFSYLLTIMIISSIHFYLIKDILSQSEANFVQQNKAQLNSDLEFLIKQLNNNIENLISEIRLIPLHLTDRQTLQDNIKKLFNKRKDLFHLNYFSADGNLSYSSKRATLEWHSNLLNSNWYRTLIKKWQVIVTDIHKSPVSPFPKVIAIAIPVIKNETVDGFWLAYLDKKYINTLFITKDNKQEGVASIWFDGNGEIINMSTADSDINESFIKRNGWWYKINEAGKDSQLTGDKEAKRYLYSNEKSKFENLQLLIVQDLDKALGLLYDFQFNIIIISVILQLIIMIVVAVILWQWQKQKIHLDELLSINNLLETKSNALVDTNAKLDRLVSELDEQKTQLIHAKNTLERVQKYLNFLTLPVIALDIDFKYEFVNRAAENEFKYTFEKLRKKPLDKFLQIKNKPELTKLLNNAKKSLQRQEKHIIIQIGKATKHFLVSCDYLLLNDWQGYIITFSDLTDILQLQKDIKIQNLFLEKSSYLSELFLLAENEKKILTKALNAINQYADSNAAMFYQSQNNVLTLKASVHEKKLTPPEKLYKDSIAASTLLSGEPVIINNKADLPENTNPIEKQFSFNRAMFYPIVINNKSIGVVIIIDPINETIADNLQKLLTHFKIGLSALISKTKLEITNEELNRSTAFRVQLLRSITHGLKTPLSTIKGYVKLILLKFKRSLDESPELYKFIKNLDIATEDLNEKIMTYLDIARINRNDLKLNNTQVNIDEIIVPLRKQLSIEANIKNITINYLNKVLREMSMVVDRERLGFVLKTIFNNALKYAPQGDTVILSVLKENSHLEISFEDHGKPISKKHIPLIGAEYLPAEVMKERLHYNDSLAMSLAVKILRLTGGQLKVSSNIKKTVHSISMPINSYQKN